MTWLAVDKDGAEKIFQNELDRNTDYWFIDKNSIFVLMLVSVYQKVL